MKIAVVAPSEIPARRANTLQVMKMAQALVLTGHEVRLAAPQGSASPGGGGMRPLESGPDEWAELAAHYGLYSRFDIQRLPVRSRWRRYDYGFEAVRWARGWEADLLYTRLPQAAALGSLLNVPTIFEVHDYPHGGAGQLLFRLFLRGRGKRRLVVITQSLAYDLAQRLVAPSSAPLIVVAPDGVDLKRFANLPNPLQARSLLRSDPAQPDDLKRALSWQAGPEPFTAGYTGHVYRGRGVELIFDLAARLPEMIFLIVGGEQQDVEGLKAKAQQLGLSNVILTGFVPNSVLPLYQAACDVLLMPYQQQVAASSGGDIARYLSPMKLFEYLACGRPILSSDLPVLREILNPANSVLLPSNDLSAWESALKSLSKDPEMGAALSAQARLDASRYTWEGRAARVLEGL